jgi:hypothetical protein
MELTFEQENFISDVACEAKKLRELEKGEVIGFHSTGMEIKPVYTINIEPEPTPDEIQELFDEVYADIPEEEMDLAWLDDLYEARKDAERDIQEDPNLYERGDYEK